MADYMVEHGNNVLMIALEMSPLELTARSISRLTAIDLDREELQGDYPRALSAKGVRLYQARREKYAPQNQSDTEYRRVMDERLEAAITRYRERIAPHTFFYSPENLIPASGVRELVEKFADVHGKPPDVILDYNQILCPEAGKERNTEKQNMDAAALTLKHISRDYKIPVLCVSSFNRMNYNEPVSMESFKESGGIEYSSDAVIGMQLYGTGFYNSKKGKTLDIDLEKGRNPRRVQARILKNRDGITGRFINLEYFPAVNLFQEVSKHPEKKFRDAPEHWKADPPAYKEASEDDAVDISAIIEAPAKRERKVTSHGK
jgi:replicative DNA helicase